jgi:hypothetical protein
MSEPRIELVQAIPGTLWQTSDAGAHHLGYWSDDIDRDIEVLVANGYALDVKSIGHGGKPYWAYCGKKGGPRIELVAAMHKPYMAEYFRTGRMPRPAGV